MEPGSRNHGSWVCELVPELWNQGWNRGGTVESPICKPSTVRGVDGKPFTPRGIHSDPLCSTYCPHLL